MPNVVTNRFLFSLLCGDFNFNSADIRACFLRSGTPTKDTNVLSELAAGIEGSRFPLSGLSVTEDDTNDCAFVDANDLVTGAMAGPNTITWLVIYLHIGTDATNTVVGAIDIPDTVLNGSTIGIAWAPPPNGLLRIGQAP